MIDKIVSMIIVLAVVLVGSIFLYVSIFKGHGAEQTIAVQQYEQEYGGLLINSLLISHENSSQYTYEALLARSLAEMNTTVTVNGQRVDVEQEFIDALDMLVGPGNYYFELKPQMQGVSISYILDGSPTMADKRATVNASLPGLRADLQELFGPEAEIYTHVYLLTSPGAEQSDRLLCPQFTAEDVICTDLKGDVMYEELAMRGFSPPAPEPYASYDSWLATTHQARTAHMSESDWASAAAYASYRYAESDERFVTNKHVVVVVADELASNSKADSCHVLRGSENMFFCFLCNSTCPVNRSSRVVAQTLGVLQENNDLFLGFYSLPCAYEYNTSLNLIQVTPYTCKYLDNNPACLNARDPYDPSTPAGWLNDPPLVNWCEQSACGGCTRPSTLPWDGKYCYHSNCNAMLIQNLSALSAATGGISADLTNLSMLTDEVYNYFSNQQAQYNFTLGAKNLSKERYVVERPLVLSSGKSMTLTFWIYEG